LIIDNLGHVLERESFRFSHSWPPVCALARINKWKWAGKTEEKSINARIINVTL